MSAVESTMITPVRAFSFQPEGFEECLRIDKAARDALSHYKNKISNANWQIGREREEKEKYSWRGAFVDQNILKLEQEIVGYQREIEKINEFLTGRRENGQSPLAFELNSHLMLQNIRNKKLEGETALLRVRPREQIQGDLSKALEQESECNKYRIDAFRELSRLESLINKGGINPSHPDVIRRLSLLNEIINLGGERIFEIRENIGRYQAELQQLNQLKQESEKAAAEMKGLDPHLQYIEQHIATAPDKSNFIFNYIGGLGISLRNKGLILLKLEELNLLSSEEVRIEWASLIFEINKRHS